MADKLLRKSFCCFLIVLIGWLIFANSIHNSFLFDDEIYIVHNPNIQHLLNFRAISSDNIHRFFCTWTFALNHALGGLKVEGYHAVNILIHIGCGLLVCWLFILILSAPKFSGSLLAVEKETLGVWSALLFVCHPIQTMAVDEITQRYTLLAAFFYLVSVCFYLKARLSAEGMSWKFLALSFLTGAIGIFCRENFVTLPLVIVLLEVLILDQGRKLVRNWVWVPFLLIPILILFTYHFNFSGVLNANFPSESHQGEEVNAFNYFLTQGRVMMIYLRLLFWPSPLNFEYDIRLSQHVGDPAVLAGFFVIGALLFLAWRCRTRYPLLSFGIFWFFLTLSVDSTIIPIPYVIAEYRLYLPLFGFCLAFVTTLRGLIQDKRILTVLMGMIILVFALLTMQRNGAYQDEVTLWTDTVAKSPNNSRSYAFLGYAYINNKEYSQALVCFNKALALDPSDNMTMINLAQLYTYTGDLDKSIAINQRLLHIYPFTTVYNNLGVAYKLKGDWPHALYYFLKAKKSPNASRYAEQINLNLAEIYMYEGKRKDAIRAYLKLPLILNL